MRTFLDTNVLVYSVDTAEPEKRRIARALLRERADELVLSAQVLSEFYWVTTRRLREPLTSEQASTAVETFAELPVVSIDARLVRDAIETSRQNQVSYWDGLILVAAREGRCDVLLTEDLAHGSTIGGVQIESPFAVTA